MTYFDSELTLSNQKKRNETKNVKKTETHFDWSTLILNQSRSILPKAYKRNFNALFCLFTMKAFKFIRGLFGKKDRREEEIRKEKMRTERENQLFNLIEEMEEEFRRFEEKNRSWIGDGKRWRWKWKRKEKEKGFMLSVSSFRGEGTRVKLVPKW